MFPAKTLFLRCTACCANSPRFSPLLFWRPQRLRNNNGSECNNWCRGAKTPRRNRRRSVLKINIYGKGWLQWLVHVWEMKAPNLVPRVSLLPAPSLSLATGGGKKRDPGNEVGRLQVMGPWHTPILKWREYPLGTRASFSWYVFVFKSCPSHVVDGSWPYFPLKLSKEILVCSAGVFIASQRRR